MASDEDDRPKTKVSHEIGQDLSLLSVEELSSRIALLTGETERARPKARLAQCGRQLFQVVTLIVTVGSFSTRGSRIARGSADGLG